ncbi:hypothetical protein QR680_013688 [Steinernema hermaphroditum]|uniref:Uncharacterized protein n=1 Tax=Steinernema hermaphroditum TaxID=289476 RepID=A0AA39I7S1_9BILA|nr:hypothetical protein QR680_013688 [Steinernema hermaphroditum]
MAAVFTIQHSFIQMRIGSLVLVLIAMGLILGAPGWLFCGFGNVEVEGYNAGGARCSSTFYGEDVKTSVSHWDDLIKKYKDTYPAITKIKGQFALFILPLLFTISCVAVYFVGPKINLDKRIELLLLVVSGLDSVACGAAEIWYDTGFGLTDGDSVGGQTGHAGGSASPHIYIIGWFFAGAFLLIGGILNLTDALMVNRTFMA